MPVALIAVARLGLDVMPLSPRVLDDYVRAVPPDALLIHDGEAPAWHARAKSAGAVRASPIDCAVSRPGTPRSSQYSGVKRTSAGWKCASSSGRVMTVEKGSCPWASSHRSWS